MNAADPALARALAATTADEMLAHLLEAWRAYGAPEIADLIDAASSKARHARPLRSLATTRPAREQQWAHVAQTHDVVELPWLIENLLVPGSVISWVNSDAIRRLDAIRGRLDDPRVVPILLARCCDTTLAWQRDGWLALFEVIETARDPRVVPLLQRLLVERAPLAAVDNELAWRLRTLDAMVPVLRGRCVRPRSPGPDAQLVEQLAACLGRDRITSSTNGQFLTEIYAAPDDDGPREVYADWLSERGDPRGELISLQLAAARGQGTPAGKLRERALLASSARMWLGEIEPAVAKTRFRFERGFLVRCVAQWQILHARPELMIHPAWSTVREYVLASGAERACDAWLDHMIALRAKRV